MAGCKGKEVYGYRRDVKQGYLLGLLDGHLRGTGLCRVASRVEQWSSSVHFRSIFAFMQIPASPIYIHTIERVNQISGELVYQCNILMAGPCLEVLFFSMASNEKHKVFGVEHVNFCIACAGTQCIGITSILIGITISKSFTRANDAHFNFPD